MNISFSSSTMSTGAYSGMKVSYGKEQPLKKEDKRDSVFISAGAQNIQSAFGQSKMGGIIDGLMKQKEMLLENKNKLIESTLENGGNLGAIKEQLKTFDEQIRTMNEQISQQLMEERQKALGLEEDKANNNSSKDKPKTVEQVESELLHAIVNSSRSMKQIEKLDKLKDKMQGEVNVIKAEVKIDGEATTSKRDRLVELNKKIEQIGNQVGDILGATNKELAGEVKQSSVTTLENKASEEENERPTENQIDVTA